MRTETAVPVLICFGVLFTRLGLRWRTAMPVPQPDMEALQRNFSSITFPRIFRKNLASFASFLIRTPILLLVRTRISLERYS